MAYFLKQSPDWQADGVEPPEELKRNGFLAGYKPPAAYFNWLFTQISLCIQEMQSKTAGENTNNDGEIFNDYIHNVADGEYAHAEGFSTTATGNRSHSEGSNTTASGIGSHAEGGNNTASGNYSHCEGSENKAIKAYSHAEGIQCEANGDASHAEGGDTTASGNYSHSQGFGTRALGANSSAGGARTTALGAYASSNGLSSNIAKDIIVDLSGETPNPTIIEKWTEQKFSLAKGIHSDVKGINCLALENSSEASGNSTIASGYGAKATGGNTIASGEYSTAGGNTTEASGSSSTANGYKTKATGECSTATGVNTEASGYGATAQGNNTTASGYYAHSSGQNTTAHGNRSHCEGTSTNKATTLISNLSTAAPQLLEDTWETTKFSLAHGSASHAQGEDCFAGGNYSMAGGKQSFVSTQSSCGFAHGNGVRVEGENAFAVGQATNAGARATVAMGVNTSATDQFATALGSATWAKGIASMATGRGTIANGYGQFVAGKFNVEYDGATGADDTTGSIFVVGCGTGDTAKANAFRITNAGKCMGVSSFSATGADYAEYFEWLDGNVDNEDRRGYFVTFEDNKIRKANAEDDYILGVISATPSVVGNAYTDMWQGMYLKDVFGERLTEIVNVPETVNEETGETMPEHTETRFIINPDYDHTRQYEGRDSRKEWACVGTHGQLIVIDDGSCEINKYCKPNSDGKATKSDEKTAFYVIERIDQNHVKVYIK